MTLIKVFLGTEVEATFVRADLEENGIKAVLQGVNVATMLPHLAGPAGPGSSVSVCVADDDAERALALIARKEPSDEAGRPIPDSVDDSATAPPAT